jgi:DNA repair protein RadA/Sms
MAKSYSQFVCQQCGYSQVGWAGKCPNCGNWGSLVETVVSTERESKRAGEREIKTKITSSLLSSIPSKKTYRISTKISELDRVLGGGLVPGQVVLLAGEPGIGKSTLLLQLADKIGNALYISGEESTQQIKIRANRLAIKSKTISLLEETNIDSVIDQAEQAQDISLIIVDSIQTMVTEDLTGLAGSVGQVRECASRLMHLAKSKNVAVFLVGHVTKEGTVAGPAVLAHIVDTVLWFEGDKTLTLRLLRAVKNRFGPTDEVGIFSMEEKGLISMGDPEKIFLTKSKKEVAGSIVSSLLQGTRPILVEIQSLVVPTKLAFPKRVAQGIDQRRLEMLLAVLIRRCGLPLFEQDVFVNVAGGIRASEPAIDLAICLSLASSYFDKAIAKNIFALGEVGLLGEIREVVAEEKRVKEARRLGFTQPITQKEYKYVNQAIRKLLR